MTNPTIAPMIIGLISLSVLKKSPRTFAIPLATGPMMKSVKQYVIVTVKSGTAKSLIVSGTIFLTTLFSNHPAKATAAMIGITGYFKYLDKDFCSIDKPAYSRVTI